MRGFALLLLVSSALHAQVPQIINYQGRVAVGTVNFNGSGLFKFALVNAAGTTTFWSNDGTSAAGSEPTDAVTLAVNKGLYSVLLGDDSVTHMTPIPNSVFANSDVRLRVWFNDGTNASQLLTPDQRLAAVGYAMTAGTLQSGAVIPHQHRLSCSLPVEYQRPACRALAQHHVPHLVGRAEQGTGCHQHCR